MSSALAILRSVNDRPGQCNGLPAVGQHYWLNCCIISGIHALSWYATGTFKEILAGAQQANIKDVGRSYKAIEKFLQERASDKGDASSGRTVGVLHVSDLLRRYCSSLGFSHTDMRHATAIAEAACPKEDG